MVDIYAELAFGQIAQMSHRGPYDIVPSEILFYGFRFCRRLYEHQRFLWRTLG